MTTWNDDDHITGNVIHKEIQYRSKIQKLYSSIYIAKAIREKVRNHYAERNKRTCWLTWVSLAIVSRHPQIIRSIDTTVANFQVNDPDLCEIRGDENQTLQPAIQFTVLYHWEVSVRISTLTLLFHGSLSYFLFILHCYERIYIHHAAMCVLYVLV